MDHVPPPVASRGFRVPFHVATDSISVSGVDDRRTVTDGREASRVMRPRRPARHGFLSRFRADTAEPEAVEATRRRRRCQVDVRDVEVGTGSRRRVGVVDATSPVRRKGARASRGGRRREEGRRRGTVPGGFGGNPARTGRIADGRNSLDARCPQALEVTHPTAGRQPRGQHHGGTGWRRDGAQEVDRRRRRADPGAQRVVFDAVVVAHRRPARPNDRRHGFRGILLTSRRRRTDSRRCY